VTRDAARSPDPRAALLRAARRPPRRGCSRPRRKADNNPVSLSALTPIAAGLVLAAALPAAAEGPAFVSSARLIAMLDFEDRDDRGERIGFGHPMPPHWYAIGRDANEVDPNFYRQPLHAELLRRRGYPTTGAVGFSEGVRHGGDFALALALDGGQAGAFLEAGVLPAIPGSDYLVTTMARTDGLDTASARLIAYFIDSHGRRIEQSAQASRPIRSPGGWQRVSVQLLGEFPDAAWIGVELHILQPGPAPDHPLGDQQVVLEDVAGAAWFDDIGVWQLPNIRVATQSAVGVIRGPDRPRLRMSVRDLIGRPTLAQVRLFDLDRREVGRQQRVVGHGAPGEWGWTPELPGYGWYLAEMTVREMQPGAAAPTDGPAVARVLSAFVWAPGGEAAAPGERERFGIDAVGAPPAELGLLPAIAEATGLGGIAFAALERGTTTSTVDGEQSAVADLLDRIEAAGGRGRLSLDPMPAALTIDIGEAAGAIDVMLADQAGWMPLLAPVLMRHGQRVDRWRLGAEHLDDLTTRDDLAGDLKVVDARLRSLAAVPTPELAWPLVQERPRRMPEQVAYRLAVSPGVPAERLGDYLDAWADALDRVTLHLELPPATELSQRRRVDSLVLRMLHAWEAGVEGLELRQPWTRAFERRAAVLPDPVLGAFASVSRRLAGRRVTGRMWLAPGIECMILEGRGGGALACWNASAEQDDVTIDAHLGGSPVMVDAFGNRKPVGEHRGRHRFTVGRTPVFIEGIDVRLALFRAGFRLDDAFIPSKQAPHRRHVLLRNPWDRPVSGRFRIHEPESWRFGPALHLFSIPPGGEVRLPVSIRTPVSEVAGPARLEASFEIDTGERVAVDLSTPVELGLRDLAFGAEAAARPNADGTRDVMVTAVITNTGDADKALYVFAQLPGAARQERLVPTLGPGETVIRSFRFRGIDPADARGEIRAGVRESNGPAMLNHRVSIEQ